MPSRSGAGWTSRSHAMVFNVYILHSKSLDRFYTGYSKVFSQRLEQHRNGSSYWTSRANDWTKVFTTEVSTESEAKLVELAIKKRGARRFLQDKGISR